MDEDAVASSVALVHGPGWPVATPEAVTRLFAALEADPFAAVAILLAPQTDTLKAVDTARLVTGTVDRDAFRAVLSPIAIRPALLPEAARRPVTPGGAVPDAEALLATACAAEIPIIEVV